MLRSNILTRNGLKTKKKRAVIPNLTQISKKAKKFLKSNAPMFTVPKAVAIFDLSDSTKLKIQHGLDAALRTAMYFFEIEVAVWRDNDRDMADQYRKMIGVSAFLREAHRFETGLNVSDAVDIPAIAEAILDMPNPSR